MHLQHLGMFLMSDKFVPLCYNQMFGARNALPNKDDFCAF